MLDALTPRRTLYPTGDLEQFSHSFGQPTSGRASNIVIPVTTAHRIPRGPLPAPPPGPPGKGPGSGIGVSTGGIPGEGLGNGKGTGVSTGVVPGEVPGNGGKGTGESIGVGAGGILVVSVVVVPTVTVIVVITPPTVLPPPVCGRSPGVTVLCCVVVVVPPTLPPSPTSADSLGSCAGGDLLLFDPMTPPITPATTIATMDTASINIAFLLLHHGWVTLNFAGFAGSGGGKAGGPAAAALCVLLGIAFLKCLGPGLDAAEIPSEPSNSVIVRRFSGFSWSKRYGGGSS
ncbi:hypothetical protein NMY22_g9770 [Coprinellus aureogranulatus]|nr:hypothetical protein NMY22_g9770 [Coprinellus aureogranulatus]